MGKTFQWAIEFLWTYAVRTVFLPSIPIVANIVVNLTGEYGIWEHVVRLEMNLVGIVGNEWPIVALLLLLGFLVLTVTFAARYRVRSMTLSLLLASMAAAIIMVEAGAGAALVSKPFLSIEASNAFLVTSLLVLVLAERSEPTVPIERVETRLRKSERVKNVSHFEREGHPLWDDFEEGLVVPRKELRDILGARYVNRLVAVVGPTGAGKTSTVLNAGYVLATHGFNVFYVRTISNIQDLSSLQTTVRQWDDPNTVLIIDECHLDSDLTDRFIRVIRDTMQHISVILASREAPGIVRGRPIRGETTLFGSLPCTQVQTTEQMVSDCVKVYLQKRLGLSREPTDQEREWFVSECGHDLLVLKRYLRAWDGITLPDRQEVVRDSWQDLESLSRSLQNTEVLDIVYLVSTLYEYEIATPHTFLSEFDIDLNLIDTLVDRGELLHEAGKLSLHHSSIARLYRDALESRQELTQRVLQVFGPDEQDLAGIRMRIFSRYLARYPHSSFEVFYALGMADEPEWPRANETIYRLWKDRIDEPEVYLRTRDSTNKESV